MDLDRVAAREDHIEVQTVVTVESTEVRQPADTPSGKWTSDSWLRTPAKPRPRSCKSPASSSAPQKIGRVHLGPSALSPGSRLIHPGFHFRHHLLRSFARTPANRTTFMNR